VVPDAVHAGHEVAEVGAVRRVDAAAELRVRNSPARTPTIVERAYHGSL
jgi:hypothetical protein